MATLRPARTKLKLRLYVAGSAPNSALAVGNLRAICDAHFASTPELEIVDMLKYPQRALADGIIVTPTLLRVSPAPMRRLIGTLSDHEQVRLALGGR